jgi:hypothetical protein
MRTHFLRDNYIRSEGLGLAVPVPLFPFQPVRVRHHRISACFTFRATSHHCLLVAFAPISVLGFHSISIATIAIFIFIFQTKLLLS